jgi:hypothetical protein
MIIEKRNYDLVIGSIPEWRQKVRYIFDGWNDIQKQKKFHNSLSFFASEVYGGRVAPVSPISQSIMNLICWGSIVRPITGNNSNNIEEPVEPPIGTVVDITYNKKTAKIEDIEDYIKGCGVNFQRAEPFIKPSKTIWQLLQDKFVSK